MSNADQIDKVPAGASVMKNPDVSPCGSTSRREFSPKTKRMAFERSKGMCEGCGITLERKRPEYDHRDADYFSKDNSLENCAVLCQPCHRAKTNRDIKIIAKTKRIRDREAGIKKRRPGFRSWRKFNGEVVYRDRT